HAAQSGAQRKDDAANPCSPGGARPAADTGFRHRPGPAAAAGTARGNPAPQGCRGPRRHRPWPGAAAGSRPPPARMPTHPAARAAARAPAKNHRARPDTRRYQPCEGSCRRRLACARAAPPSGERGIQAIVSDIRQARKRAGMGVQFATGIRRTSLGVAVAILARQPTPATIHPLLAIPTDIPQIAPLAITACTATTALGSGMTAQLDALRERRGGLRRNDLPGLPLECWIGRVDGLEDAPLPATWSIWESRNHRLAWLALCQDGFADAAAAAVARHGAGRVAVVMGTSTSSIGETERAYLEADAGRMQPGQVALRVHNPHSLGDFVRVATGARGACMTVATACSSSAKVFAHAARLLQAGVADAAIVGGVDTLCGSVLFGFNALQLVSAEPCRPFDARRDGLS